jgi:hypothetical protein
MSMDFPAAVRTFTSRISSLSPPNSRLSWGYDGQLLELFLCQAGKDSFEEVGQDVLTSLIAEKEFEGEVDFGKHDVHGFSIPGGLGKDKPAFTANCFRGNLKGRGRDNGSPSRAVFKKKQRRPGAWNMLGMSGICSPALAGRARRGAR